VEVLPGAKPAISHIAYNITFFYKITFFDDDLAKMGVEGLEPKEMIDTHHVAVSIAAYPSLRDDPIGSGSNRDRPRSADVDARMEFSFFEDGMLAPSKGGGDGEFWDRAARWDQIQDKGSILRA